MPRVRKKGQIHFVNARPSSETEKLTAQRAVRAHVGKWISSQNKSRSPTDHSNPDGVDQDTQDHDGLLEVQSLQGWLDGEASAASSPWTTSEEEPGLEMEYGPYIRNFSSSSMLLGSEPSEQSSVKDKHPATDTIRSPDPMGKLPLHGQQRETDGTDGTEVVSLQYDRDPGHARSLTALSSPTIPRFASNIWDPFHSYPSDLPAEFLHFHERYRMFPIE